MYENLDKLFMLRVKLDSKYTLSVTAWDGGMLPPRGHTRLDVRARLTWEDGTGKRKGRTVFNRGDTWCGLPSGHTTDGDDAKELVLSLLSMKPGDTDADYFARYTPEQLEFAESHGEELSFIKVERYGER